MTPDRQLLDSHAEPPLTHLSAHDLMQALPEAVVAIDPAGRLGFINRAAERLLQVSAAQADGRHWSEMLRLFDPGDEAAAGIVRLHAPLIEDNQDRHLLLRRRDGSERVIQIRSIEDPTLLGATAATFLLIHDCTDTYARVRRLEWQCAHDHLTKLVNRREFEHRLCRVLKQARTEGTQHVLMFMDLDGFKPINDQHGHPAGDAVLRGVARILGETVRERDTLARLGGDEFGLLMEHCTAHEGWRVANALRDALRRRQFGSGSARFGVGLSIGMVSLDQTSGVLSDVVAAADDACYRAKRRGGDQVHYHRAGPCIDSGYSLQPASGLKNL